MIFDTNKSIYITVYKKGATKENQSEAYLLEVSREIKTSSKETTLKFLPLVMCLKGFLRIIVQVKELCI